MEERISRIMIAGTNSGCGKTTVTCGVLQALKNRGLRVGAFKCGPDYIDPMFHSRIIGAKSANLDLTFFGKNTLKYLLCKNGRDQDISVIEGVMGFYDGQSLTSYKASSYEISEASRTPVILTVNVRGAALSVLAEIEGFLHFCPHNQIRGVILNQCSPMTYEPLKKEILSRFEGRIQPLGYLPVMKDCVLESRHLGLVTAAEVENLKEKLSMMASQTEKTVDLDGILTIAREADPVCYEDLVLPKGSKPVRIAVARDNAFCFYYEDNLELLREMGAEIVPFSPLTHKSLPGNIQGLYLGGGYPELYSGPLSANTSMCASIREAVLGGLPTIAECGGFMYLTEAIGKDRMAGVLKGSCQDQKKLVRFGYITLTAQKDNLLCKAGEHISAHEFHHWDAEDPGCDFTAVKPSGKSWTCGFAGKTLYAGYPHFHFYSNLTFGENFYRACEAYEGGSAL